MCVFRNARFSVHVSFATHDSLFMRVVRNTRFPVYVCLLQHTLPCPCVIRYIRFLVHVCCLQHDSLFMCVVGNTRFPARILFDTVVVHFCEVPEWCRFFFFFFFFKQIDYLLGEGRVQRSNKYSYWLDLLIGLSLLHACVAEALVGVACAFAEVKCLGVWNVLVFSAVCLRTSWWYFLVVHEWNLSRSVG